jgi:hypothetical protein
MMFVSRKKDIYRPPCPVTGIALFFYMKMFVPHRKKTSGPQRPVTKIDLLSTLWVMSKCSSDNHTTSVFRIYDGRFEGFKQH